MPYGGEGGVLDWELCMAFHREGRCDSVVFLKQPLVRLLSLQLLQVFQFFVKKQLLPKQIRIKCHAAHSAYGAFCIFLIRFLAQTGDRLIQPHLL